MDLMTEHLMLADIPIETESPSTSAFVRKFYDTTQKGINEGERSVTSYITTLALDRDREVVLPEGGELGDYRKNPVVLALHNYRSLPIGKNLWIKRDKKGLLGKTQYAKHEQADLFFNYRRDGFPMAQSIGFIPLETIERDSDAFAEQVSSWKDAHKEAFGKKPKGEPRRFYSKWLLLEYSDVPVPSNPEALTLAVGKGYGSIIEPSLLDLKRVIPFSVHGDGPKAPEDSPWNGPAEIRQAEVSDLRIMSTWFDAENADVKGSYKLPHHRAAGQHPVVWRGVRAAMAALFGARGGVNVPAGDRRGIYNHLARHYRQFDREPPEFRELGEYSEDDLKMLFKLHEQYGDEYEFVMQEEHAQAKLDYIGAGEPATEAIAKEAGVIMEIDDEALERIKRGPSGEITYLQPGRFALGDYEKTAGDVLEIEPEPEIEIDPEPEIELEAIETAPELEELPDSVVEELAVELGRSIGEFKNAISETIKNEVRVQLDLMKGKLS